MKNYNQNQNTSHRQRGMTMIELLIAIAILIIITTAAVPSMKSLLESKSVSAIADFFIKSVRLARVEAIQRSQTVRIVTLSGTGDWADGWDIEYTDDDGDTVTVRSFPALSGQPIFTSNSFNEDNDLSILPTGQVVTPGTLTILHPNCIGDRGLTINILLSGLVQKQVLTCPEN